MANRSPRKAGRKSYASVEPSSKTSRGRIPKTDHKPRRQTAPKEDRKFAVKESGTLYSPTYAQPPFVRFETVTPDTPLSVLNLNWRERDLPERVRTKHVHRLHPYLGKFIPQLVEIFLRKYPPLSVCDPFCGSGTTLVEANALGIPSVGCDISEFNCLLARVKTAEYDISSVRREVFDILGRVKQSAAGSMFASKVPDTENAYLVKWFAPRARIELLTYLSFIRDYQYQDLLKVILSRSARSARLTTHFDLDFPKHPQTKQYYCYKHSRICSPTSDALQFLHRYSVDTVARLEEYAKVRTHAPVTVMCGDARTVEFPKVHSVVTSPPYVGLIDYHEQHRYAYELLGLPRRDEDEIGAARKGNSEKSRDAYIRSVQTVFENVGRSLDEGAPVIVVVNDRQGLYADLRKKLPYAEEAVITRHVNRRTGRRNGSFYEHVLVWRKRCEREAT